MPRIRIKLTRRAPTARAIPSSSLERADELVDNFRQTLKPFGVDIRGIPSWPLGPAHERSMQDDAVDLREFAGGHDLDE